MIYILWRGENELPVPVIPLATTATTACVARHFQETWEQKSVIQACRVAAAVDGEGMGAWTCM